MTEKSSNFVSDIHEVSYMTKYMEKTLCASGLNNSTGRDRVSLNGTWNFVPDLYDTLRRAKWFMEDLWDDCGCLKPVDWDWDAWEPVQVPSCWNLEKKECFYFEGTGLYTRCFQYVPKLEQERVFLRFEGANYRTSVFLNGIHMGTHDGGSTPFCIEISDVVKEENRIIVAVDASRRPERVPMDNTDWFNYGGLYRDVYLLQTPDSFIKDWFLRLGKKNGELEFDAELVTGASFVPEIDRELVLRIPELGLVQRIPVESDKVHVLFPAIPQLWSCDNPKLYDVELSYGTDLVRDRIGFRRIAVRGTEIFLNDKAIFLKGISVHEDHIEKGKSTDETTIRSTIAHLKELGGNYLRLAHYPHDSRFARIADEEGVLLWEEIPVYWAIAFENPATYADGVNQLSELILRDRNRASVIIWSVGNENADTDARLSFMSSLVRKAKELDGTRPVSAACLVDHQRMAIADRLAEHLDIIGINEYYGWYDPDFEKLPHILNNSNPDKPVLICEFGGGARCGHRGAADDLFTEDMQKKLYEKQVEVIKACPYIKGTSPWILYDFRCPRRLNRYQEGFNRKGLIDCDRVTKKLAFTVLADFYKNHNS